MDEDNFAIRPAVSAKPNLKGDWSNFLLLILLYTMQGLPFGLAVAFPIIFQSKKIVSYHEQVRFGRRPAKDNIF